MSAEAITLPIEISISNQGQIKGGIKPSIPATNLTSGVIFRPMKLEKGKIATKVIIIF